ncbi:electron transport complex protein RnfA [Steroidobacter denitrificans]|nr:Rnf-Nqr domain containing protein [Steroidobacter denitrificans]
MSTLLVLLLGSMLINVVAMNGAPHWRPFTPMNDEFAAAGTLALAHLIALPPLVLGSWLLFTQLLEPLAMTYLRTPVFVAWVLTIVPLVEIMLRRCGRSIPERPGFMALMIANAALLGTALLASGQLQTPLAVLGFSLAAAVALGFLLLAFTALRVRLRHADVPAVFGDAPLSLLTAGIMALAFMGFTGLFQE